MKRDDVYWIKDSSHALISTPISRKFIFRVNDTCWIQIRKNFWAISKEKKLWVINYFFTKTRRSHHLKVNSYQILNSHPIVMKLYIKSQVRPLYKNLKTTLQRNWLWPWKPAIKMFVIMATDKMCIALKLVLTCHFSAIFTKIYI